MNESILFEVRQFPLGEVEEEEINPCPFQPYDGSASGDRSKSLGSGGIFCLPDGPKLVGQAVTG